MRVWVTGGGGFVGSNIVAAAVAAGHDVMTTAHSFEPPSNASYSVDRADMTDAVAVARSVDAFGPDMVVHNAIMNDWARMYADRHASWAAYVGATRNTTCAARSVGAHHVTVSTDWVFDGSQPFADEDTPPNPINLYGTMKAACEMVTLERGGAVARISGVQGLHLARPTTPWAQDRGFGYFTASIVKALSSGEPFTVWEAPDMNMRATPSLALECGELMVAIGEQRVEGVFHLCGADSVSRRELAELTCDVFDLDRSLLRYGPPPPDANAAAPIPYDTTLTAPRTSAVLGRSPTPLRALLERFRRQIDSLENPA
ncbi:MAG: SDR family oxidoreductase [Acidimicrobiales bacterium]